MNFALAAKAGDALLNAEQSHAFYVSGVEAAAVVLNGELERIALLLGADAYARRARVAGAIMQRFLDDAIDAGFVIVGQIVGDIGGDADFHSAALGNFASLPLEGGDEAEIVEHGRTEQQRHIAHHANGVLDQALHGFDARAIVGAGEARGQIAELDQDAGERLADFIVQLARDGAALGFLRLDQASGQFGELAAGFGDFLKSIVGASFELENPAGGEGGHADSEDDGGEQSDGEAGAKAAEQADDELVAGVQLLFVDGGDTIGDGQHVLTSRKDGIAQEGVAGALALGGIPLEDGLEDLPIFGELGFEGGVMAGIDRLAAVGFDGGIDLFAELFELGTISVGALGIGIEKIIAHVGSGEVDLGSNAVEQVILIQELAADAIVVLAEIAQHAQGVDAGGGHDQQKAAKAGEQRDAAAEEESARVGGIRHRERLEATVYAKSSRREWNLLDQSPRNTNLPVFGAGRAGFKLGDRLSRLPNAVYRSHMTFVSSVANETFEKLKKLDTCTASNAIERLNVRMRNEGFMAGTVRCRFPKLKPMLGYAATGRIRSSSPPMKGRCYYDRLDFWNYVASLPAPRVMVLADVDHQPGLGALVGEIHASIALALNCIGYVTNGSVRDLPAVRALGFHMFSGSISVSHAYAHMVDFGVPVELAGLKVNSGDLIHGDVHGVHTIPLEIAAAIPAEVEEIVKSEEELKEFCRSREFTLEKLEKRLKKAAVDCL